MTKEVEQHTWAFFEKTGYPEDVEIIGLGPCTGILVFDPSSRNVYGAHLVSPHLHEEEQLFEMLAAAKQAFAGKPNIEIWVSGCCEKMDGAEHAFSDIRNHVKAAVTSEFPNAKIHFSWPPKEVVGVGMVLDQATGECEIKFSRGL